MRERALVPTLVVVTLMVSLISSLGAPLVPSLAAAHHVSLAAAQWSLTITLLVGAVATPVLGRLGDGAHRRRVLLVVISAVFAGSLLAALPFGFGALLAGRALQGLGLGLLPLTMAVAHDHLPPERSRPAVALLAVTGVAGVGLGYPVTGLIAQHGGTHGAFWFGAALSGAALALAVVVLPASTRRSAGPLDVVGAALVGVGFASLLVGLAHGSVWGWGSPRLLLLVLASVLVLAAFVRHELRTDHPLVDLRQLTHRAVLVADISGLLTGMALYLVMSLSIRLVQTPASTGYGIGASVAVGGLILVPMSVTSVLSSRLVPVLTRRVSADRLLPIGTLVLATGLGLLSVWRHSLWQVMVVLAVVGLGIGLSSSVMPALVLRAVPPSEAGSATAFNQVLRTAGYAAGSALSGTILQAHTAVGAALPSESGYRVGALVGIGLCALTVAVVVPLLPRRRRTAVVDRELGAMLADGPERVLARSRA